MTNNPFAFPSFECFEMKFKIKTKMKIRASTDLYENTNLDICERSNHAIQLLIQNFQNKHF